MRSIPCCCVGVRAQCRPNGQLACELTINRLLRAKPVPSLNPPGLGSWRSADWAKTYGGEFNEVEKKLSASESSDTDNGRDDTRSRKVVTCALETNAPVPSHAKQVLMGLSGSQTSTVEPRQPCGETKGSDVL